MSRLPLFLGVLLTMPLAAAAADNVRQDEDVRIEKDVAYLASDRQEKGDLYRPTIVPNGQRFPAVLIIHGGGWTGGDKGAAREINIGTNLARNGYVGFSIDYLLAKDGRPSWPQNLHDCMTAVRWLRKNAERLNIDPEHIGVIGGSAGGHLAAMMGVAGPRSGLDPKGPYGEYSCRVQAAVDMYGPTDLMTCPERPAVRMLGAARNEKPELFQLASPVAHADKHNPPILILHGTADATVALEQSRRFAEALEKAGAQQQLLIIEGAPHSFHLQPKQRDLRPVVLGFFDQYLKPSAAKPALTARADAARDILAATGVRGGLVVHLGCGDGRLTAALHAGENYLVHGLDADPAKVELARRQIAALGLRGTVSFDRWTGDRLPYADNLVNLLVIADAKAKLAEDEIRRVLAPGGTAIWLDANAKIQNQKFSKPWPNDIDQWTHYLHGPDNNAVAHDTVVGPPRHVQWLAAPAWTRNHHTLNSVSSVVTAQGRLFAIVDEAAAANINLPGQWAIVARDAFNGVTLWKKPLPSWTWHQIRFRSGPPQVTRLLVACGDRLYAPLGLGAAVSAINAATGETVETFRETAGAEEMVLAGHTLLVLRGGPVAEQAFAHPAFAQRYRLPNEKSLVAVDVQTGKTLWTWSAREVSPMPETLASDGKQAYLQIDEGVACFDLRSGQQRWRYGDFGRKTKRKAVTFGKNTLVVAEDVVLCNLSGKLTALAAQDGKKLWDCAAGGGFHSPLDVFVIGGLVWQGLHDRDSVAPPPVHDFSEGRDLHTGEVKATNAIAVDLQTAGHHHRCYREKATDRFIITGKRGIEMIDLAGSDHCRNNWVRGTCQYGILPANGLVYAPPHACGCYMEAKLRGFWALAAERGTRDEDVRPTRLELGPAYTSAAKAQPAAPNPQSLIPNPSDWPMYRHDPLRRGVATTTVPVELKQLWQTPIGGRLTQPVIAEGRVVLAGVDDGTVYALDETSGKVAWKHFAGGRVDSPPTIHRGMVLFGSADGRVTCLRLSDGQLVWRFLAAPAEIRTVAMDRVESLWPVHGSVLVLGGIAYCSAGRSTWLDGGIDLYGLDPATGKVLCKAHFESRHPQFQEGKDKAREDQETRVAQNLTDYRTFLASDRSDSFSMAEGAVSDVLVSDGTNVFLHHVKFNARLERQEQLSRHLFSTSSLLDDTESHRSHWVLGTGDFSRIPVAYSWIVDRPGKMMPTIAVPAGVMIVYDDGAVWGVRNQGNANGKYELFKKENRPFAAEEKSLADFRQLSAREVDPCAWKDSLPVRATAMLKSGTHLFLGVAPSEIPQDDPHAAYEGRRGGTIWVCSDNDGTQVAQYPLDSPLVWDGMAAANGRLYLCTQDGKAACLGPVKK